MIYKFRSMHVCAEESLLKSKEAYAEFKKNDFKHHPQQQHFIPLLGKMLRTTSIDELPQVLNVLKGEMSIVGPRPIVAKELSQYGAEAASFVSVKPGLTGYWQVNGRSKVRYPERTKLELYYVEHCSVMLDLKLILMTIKVVVLRIGAQ